MRWTSLLYTSLPLTRNISDLSYTCLSDCVVEYLPGLCSPAPVYERRPVEVRRQPERPEVQEGLLGQRGRPLELGPYLEEEEDVEAVLVVHHDYEGTQIGV